MPIVENELLPKIVKITLELIPGSKLREPIKQPTEKTKSRNRDRDEKILELYRQGRSRKAIGRELGMSAWGISKALKRLGAT
jgi:DNA-binding NarL/FixJ family response regulator